MSEELPGTEVVEVEGGRRSPCETYVSVQGRSGDPEGVESRLVNHESSGQTNTGVIGTPVPSTD